VTERSEIIIKQSPPGQGGAPRSGDSAGPADSAGAAGTAGAADSAGAVALVRSPEAAVALALLVAAGGGWRRLKCCVHCGQPFLDRTNGNTRRGRVAHPARRPRPA